MSSAGATEWIFLQARLLPVLIPQADTDSVLHPAAPSGPSSVLHANDGYYNALPMLFEHMSQHPLAHSLLRSLSDTFVLVGSKHSENLIKRHEKSWQEVLNAKQYQYLEATGFIPLGYVSIDRGTRGFVGVRWIETLVRRHNLGLLMLQRLEHQLRYRCLPLTVEFAYPYWLGYFVHHLQIRSASELRRLYRSVLKVPIESYLAGHRDLQVGLDMVYLEQNLSSDTTDDSSPISDTAETHLVDTDSDGALFELDDDDDDEDRSDADIVVALLQ